MFDDVADPPAALQPLPYPDEFIDPLQLFNAVGDLLSPTAWVSEIRDVVFGFNPLDEAAEKFAGDWAAYVEAASSWKSLAGASDAISRNLKSGLQELDSTWKGHAADSAYVHFDQVVKALRKQGDVLERAHGQFMLAGEGVWREGKSIADTLKMIGDLALLAAVEVAAGHGAG